MGTLFLREERRGVRPRDLFAAVPVYAPRPSTRITNVIRVDVWTGAGH